MSGKGNKGLRVGPWQVLSDREIKHTRVSWYRIDGRRIKTEDDARNMLQHVACKAQIFNGFDVDSLAEVFARLGILRGRAA